MICVNVDLKFLSVSTCHYVACCACINYFCGDSLLEIKCTYSLCHTTLDSTGKDFYISETHSRWSKALNIIRLLLSGARTAKDMWLLVLWLCLLDSKKYSYCQWTDSQKQWFWGTDEAQARSSFLRIILPRRKPRVLIGQIDAASKILHLLFRVQHI